MLLKYPCIVPCLFLKSHTLLSRANGSKFISWEGYITCLILWMLLVICGINLPEVTYKPLHEQNCYDKLRCRSIKCFLLLIIILLFVMPLFEVLQPFFFLERLMFSLGTHYIEPNTWNKCASCYCSLRVHIQNKIPMCFLATQYSCFLRQCKQGIYGGLKLWTVRI